MSEKVPVHFQFNGESRELDVDPRALLIEVVRDDLQCPGARVGCLTGDCGACGMLLDGKIVKSCLVLMAACEGRDVETIENIHTPLMERIQAAFVQHKGFQCGYCTTGMVLVAFDLLSRNPDATRAEVRHSISGNLCRCTGYEAIVDAIEAARNAKFVEV